MTLNPAPTLPGPDMQSGVTLYARFAATAEVHSVLPALIWPQGEISFGQLLLAVETLAKELRRVSRCGGKIAVLVDDPANALIAQWAVLSNGSAFVPLSTSTDLRRNVEILEICAAKVVITDNNAGKEAAALCAQPLVKLSLGMRGALEALSTPSSAVVAPSSSLEPAYILFTSGTTGRPKAVVQSGANTTLHATRYAQSTRLGPGSRQSWLSHYSFDAACMDIYGAMLHGATLICPGFGVQGIGQAIPLFRQYPPTVFHSTPTVFRTLIRNDGAQVLLRKAQFVVLGGELAYTGDLQSFVSAAPPDSYLINGLGPSECSLALQARFSKDDACALLDNARAHAPLPVGHPVDGIAARMQSTPTGEQELQISGKGVFDEYFADPERTKAAFCTDQNRSWYRTGDLVSYDVNWGYVFRARRDHNIKIRGQWINLAECAAILRQDIQVQNAVIAPQKDSAGNIRTLVAYVVFTDAHATVDPKVLRALPLAAQGLQVRAVDSLSVMANGKVQSVNESMTSDPVEPVIDLSEDAITAFLLRAGIEVSPEEDIFDAGLDSLTFTELSLHFQTAAGRPFDIDAFLEDPCIRQFVELLAERSTNEAD
ncbi:non-ribosomal peptide synthetase (plasmid) [Phaeobacter sp. BS23]|uniref:non-ribosomal peptide synthetase n=1 Tax=Phaeobacter sp. BS23 TaxID=2907239 RepID=UPI0037041140